MTPVLFAAVRTAVPPEIAAGDLLPWALALAFLALAGFFAVLRGALTHSVKSRVLDEVSAERRAKLEPLLDRADSLALSAAVFKLVFELAFGVLVLGLVMAISQTELTFGALSLSLVISVPALLLVGELLPLPFSDRRGDALLCRFLPAFGLLQLPLEEFVRLLEVSRRAVLRAFGLRPQSTAERELVAGLRGAMQEGAETDLGQTERELIENVIDFRASDVAEIMTPRTEIQAVAVDATFDDVLSAVTSSPHSRLPVHAGGLDRIVGTVAAKDLLRLIEGGRMPEEGIHSIVRPAYFVPETKLVADLLGELRRERTKMAVVLDEYGGTAGLVTLGDVLAELVGELPDEHSEAETPIRFDPAGFAEVDAALRVSEVNEALELSIPEEADYETLGGFVLAKLGHFPKLGERFVQDSSEFKVLDASDRRVLRVAVRRLAAGPA